MKSKTLLLLLLCFAAILLKAQNISKQHFEVAYQEISAMLEGKQPLNFEKAVFLTENAYRENAGSYEDFKAALDIHSGIVEQLIKNNDKHDWKQFVKGNSGITPEKEIQVKEQYRKALANWAIFTYLTDTLAVQLEGQQFSHLPYTYSNDDPFGTTDWKNSQVINLLETQRGNCYALVTLFKILSERFGSEASMVTAPQHIYIEHRDPNGNRFNVEVATRSFPDMGTIQTLTYTTRAAMLNNISMRKLDLKQSIGLCLVYLAKGYEYKNTVKDDEFMLACANTALQHDPKNLNALLLQAQVYEKRVIKGQMDAEPYENVLANLYTLGYRQMPDDMKNSILSKIRKMPQISTPTDRTPNPFEDIGEQARYVTLSNGLFEEAHKPEKLMKYGQTIFDTEKSKIVKFLDGDISSYQVDPVVFALSVDPLTKSYPWYTPYQFAGNKPIVAIDLDGLEEAIVIKSKFYEALIGSALKNGDAGEAMRLAYKAVDDPAKSKFAEKMYGGIYAAQWRMSGTLPSGISLVSSTGKIMHTQEIGGQVIGDPANSFEFNIRLSYGPSFGTKVKLLGIGQALEGSFTKELATGKLDDSGFNTGLIEDADSPWRLKSGGQFAGLPIGIGVTRDFTSKGVVKSEGSLNIAFYEMSYDAISHKASDKFKVFDLSYGFGLGKIETDLSFNSVGYKPYQDPTKVARDATRYETNFQMKLQAQKRKK